MNYDIAKNIYELGTSLETNDYQTKFTQKEIDDLPERWMRCLKQVPVEE